MRPLPVPGDDSGLSLAETLVASSLLVVVTALASTMFVTGQRAADSTGSRGQAAEAQRVAFAGMTRVLRTSTRVLVAGYAEPQPAVQHTSDGRRVVVYAVIDPTTSSTVPSRPSRVTFAVDAAGTLTESVTRGQPDLVTGAYTFPSTPERTRVLATRIRNTPGQPVFGYAQPSPGTPEVPCATATATATASPTGCVVPLSAAGTEAATLDARKAIRSITVDILLEADTPRAGSAVAVKGRVFLPASGVMRARL